MIQAVLFDLDGTLLNRDVSLKGFINNQYERLKECIGHIPKDQYIARFIELDKRGYVWKDKVYQQLTHELDISRITWEELLQDYLDNFRFDCVPFDNLKTMLEKLKSNDILLGMITNGYGQFQLDNIKALGIEQYFDVILVSEWEELKKPDPKIFQRALEQLNVSPAQSIFIGDHPVNDVKASKNIGMIGIWKKDSQWDDVDADFVVDDLSELPLIISNLSGKVKTC